MALSVYCRAIRWRIPVVALATLTLGQSPALAQTVYREYDDGRVETFSGEYRRDGYLAPLRRPPRDFDDDEDDDRFERDDPDDYDAEDPGDRGFDDRQGRLDVAPGTGRAPPPRPPPSVNARPDEKAWKPDL